MVNPASACLLSFYGFTQSAEEPVLLRPLQLAGLVERVTFHSDESGYCVLRIKARGHRDLVTVVGTLPEVRAGEWLEAQDRWIVNKEYGQQFQAQILRTAAPTTVEGIEKYLASGMIKGIGPVLAGRIVRAYKERTFEIIDADPHSLTYVDGIGKHRKQMITAAWQQQKAIREIMVFLHGHKVSTSRALLYTSVTRAKKLVVLVGTLKALAIAVKNMDARRRVPPRP